MPRLIFGQPACRSADRRHPPEMAAADLRARPRADAFRDTAHLTVGLRELRVERRALGTGCLLPLARPPDHAPGVVIPAYVPISVPAGPKTSSSAVTTVCAPPT